MKIIWFGALFALGASAAGAFAAEREPVALAPASEWSLKQTAERCRLTRTFGAGADKLLLRIDRYRPGGDFNVVLAGGALAKVNWMDVSLRFGPVGGAQDIDNLSGASVGSYKPGFYASTPLIADGGDPAGVTALDVVSRARPTLRLQLGPMTKPIADIGRCAEGLVAGWGLDPEAQRNLSREPAPANNAGEWVTTSDYPRELIRRGAEGTVFFRVNVDAAGAPTQCTVQEATDPPGFGEAVCASVLRRARFEPALDAGGKPIASYFATRARFEIMRGW